MRKLKSDWNFTEIFLSGLVTAISINYLVSGFWDIVVNFSYLVSWLDQSRQLDSTIETVKRIVGQ